MLWNVLLLIGISLAWASNYLFIREAGSHVPPLSKGAMTLSFAAALLLLIVGGFLRRPLHHTLRANWVLILILGLTAIALPNLSVVAAEQNITSGMASVVGTAVPVMTFLFTIVFLRHYDYTHTRMVGVVLAVTGVSIYVGWQQLARDNSDLTSVLIMLAGGCIFAINGVVSESKTAHIDGTSLTALVLLAGTVYLTILAFVFERQDFVVPNARDLFYIALAGFIGNALAFLGYFVLLKRATAYFTSFYAYLVPLLGVFLGVLFLDRPLTMHHIAGLAMVLVGLRLLLAGPKTGNRDVEHAA